MSTFFDRHQARVALATRIAKDSLHIAINYYMYEQWPRVERLVYDFIMERIRPFIESGDVENIEVRRYVMPDVYENMPIDFEVRVIPTQVVSFTTKIDFTIDHGE